MRMLRLPLPLPLLLLLLLLGWCALLGTVQTEARSIGSSLLSRLSSKSQGVHQGCCGQLVLPFVPWRD